jgi:hypothetical protein
VAISVRIEHQIVEILAGRSPILAKKEVFLKIRNNVIGNFKKLWIKVQIKHFHQKLFLPTLFYSVLEANIGMCKIGTFPIS